MYVPLWIKSNHSFLEGASHPEQLVERAHALDLSALAITDRAYAFGADLGTVLTDLLELTHMLTRLRSVPGLRDRALPRHDVPPGRRPLRGQLLRFAR